MYALDVKNGVYNRQNETWKKISGLCTQIEVADKDTVFCVNQEGQVWQYKNKVWFLIKVPAKFVHISVSSNKQAVGLDAQGNVYFKNFFTPSWNWTLVPGIKLA
jgi:hypothetical protein